MGNLLYFLKLVGITIRHELGLERTVLGHV